MTGPIIFDSPTVANYVDPLPARFCGPGFRSLTRSDWYALREKLLGCNADVADIYGLELDILVYAPVADVLMYGDRSCLQSDDTYWGTGLRFPFNFRMGLWAPLRIGGYKDPVTHPGTTKYIRDVLDVDYAIFRPSHPSNSSVRVRQLYDDLFDFVEVGRVRVPDYVWDYYFPEERGAATPTRTSEDSHIRKALQFFGNKAPLTCTERNGFYDRYDD